MTTLPRRPALRVLVPLLLALLGLTTIPAPAQASFTTLCRGYKACADAGMSHAGYAQAGSTMYWRMYAGHNCTNYVAYRLIQSGMPNVRPWEGGGNATYWGSHMSSITDQTPTVGSVAWWKAGVYPAGSAGHVAYVEEVVSPDEIIVSQDWWGGDFSWARITKGSKGWPSGFIHFNDAPLVNVAKPALAGTPKVGAVLTATPGEWDPGDVQTEYRWLVDGERLRGATAPTLTVDETHLGRRVKVRVIASQVGYATARATSSATPEVLPGTISSTSAPVVSGEPVVDQTLSVSAGGWFPVPDAVTYRWYADGEPLPSANTSDLALTPALEGRTVTAEVTASREGYEPVTQPVAAGVVAPGTLTMVGMGALDGVTRPGERLVLTAPRTEQESRATVRWLRDDVPVEGTDDSSYDLTTADLGSRITAEITLERPGYTPVTETFTSDRVRAPSELEVNAERAGRHGGKVRLALVATAEGIEAVEGVVRVRSLGSAEKVQLRDGAAGLVLQKVPAKGFRVKVVHPGSATTERAVEAVRVRRLRS